MGWKKSSDSINQFLTVYLGYLKTGIRISSLCIMLGKKFTIIAKYLDPLITLFFIYSLTHISISYIQNSKYKVLLLPVFLCILSYDLWALWSFQNRSNSAIKSKQIMAFKFLFLTEPKTVFTPECWTME